MAEIKLKVPSALFSVKNTDKNLFCLHQGSEEETEYTWSFGNGSSPVTIKGLQNAASVTTSFNMVGLYNITVVAVNSKGKAQAVLPVHVEGSYIKYTNFLTTKGVSATAVFVLIFIYLSFCRMQW